MVRSHFLRVSPSIPSRSIKRTIEHYARFGFSATLTADEFAILERDGIELHFALKPDHDPDSDLDLHSGQGRGARDMKTMGLHLKETDDTAYGMRETSSQTTNVILFGSALLSR